MSRAFALRQAETERVESAWQCDTCPAPREEDSRYCRHCRMYWNDLENGLFEEVE
jgi:hypothetical protein